MIRNPHAAFPDSTHTVYCHGEHPPTPEHPEPYGPDALARWSHPRNTSRLIGDSEWGGLWHCPEHYACPTCPRRPGTLSRKVYTEPAYRLVDTWNGGTSEPRTVWVGKNPDDAMRWVLDHTPFSYNEATTRQGYRLEPIP
jgi:hypothetical protein